MQVRILFFGLLKDVFHKDSQGMELAPGARVADLLSKCRQLVAQEAPAPLADESGSIWNSIAVAVNQQYVSSDTALQDGDEVALLPPVSGGHDAAVIALTREAILTREIIAGARQPEDGAVVVFDGIVRNNTRGRRTLYLDYEAYPAMALEQMRELVARAHVQFAVHSVSLVHRLGRLQIGETSVLIVVASAHRAAAFDACRWLIDSLKKSVPIWKKEYFEDGAVWAPGEPFPEELRAGGAA